MVGEHIRVRKGGRWHHAIDCGDETVLHLADDPGEGPVRVRRSYRPEFVLGAESVEVVTHRERTFPPNEVIARAFSRIADPVLASMFRDSEAFAKWCSTGRMPTTPEAVSSPTPAQTSGEASARGKATALTKPRAPARAKAPRGKARPAKRPAASRKAKSKAGGRKAKSKAGGGRKKARPAPRKAKPARRAPRRHR